MIAKEKSKIIKRDKEKVEHDRAALERKRAEKEMEARLEEERLEGLTKGKTSTKGLIRFCLLQVWDGLTFFGFDDTKLDRLRGRPLDFLTKFTSIKWIVMTFASLIAILVVFWISAMKYGDEKSKELALVEQDSYTYDIRDTLPLKYVHWFWIGPLFDRVRRF